MGWEGEVFHPPPSTFPFPSLPPVTCAQERRERILVLPHRLKDRLRDILMPSHAPFRLEFYVQLNLSKTATLETEKSGRCSEVYTRVNVWTVRQKSGRYWRFDCT